MTQASPIEISVPGSFTSNCIGSTQSFSVYSSGSTGTVQLKDSGPDIEVTLGSDRLAVCVSFENNLDSGEVYSMDCVTFFIDI